MNSIEIEIKGKNLNTGERASILINGGLPTHTNESGKLEINGTSHNEIAYKIAVNAAAVYYKLVDDENYLSYFPYITEELRRFLDIK